MAKYGEWGYSEEEYQHYADMNTPTGVTYVIEPMEAIFDPINLLTPVLGGSQSFEQVVAELSPGIEADLEMLVQDATDAILSSQPAASAAE